MQLLPQVEKKNEKGKICERAYQAQRYANYIQHFQSVDFLMYFQQFLISTYKILFSSN